VNGIESLVKLQETDQKIRAMTKEMADIPARKKSEQDRLEEHKKQVADKSLNLKHHQSELKKLELEVESRREKIRKLRQQQMELKTNKEFKAIESEVAAVEKDIIGLDDQQLSLMDQVEMARADLKEKEKALLEEEAAVKRDMTVWDQRGLEIAKALEAEKVVRAELVKAVDPAWLAPYERIFEKKDRALVPVDDGICGGCHMKLPPFLAHAARKQQNVVTCGFCGRMLYS
jgi:uncharacterized protein